MKVLIMPPLISLVKEPPNIPDLGLGYIAASLENNGHEVYVRDWNMNPSAIDFKKWLVANKPELIGIKVFTKDVDAARKTISIIRETLPEVTIVIGGPHPSAADPIELMEDFLECDYAIKGEAEISFPRLLAEIEKARVKEIKSHVPYERAKGISGLVWRNKEKIFSNSISLIQDIDKIAFPAWEMINPQNYSVSVLDPSMEKDIIAPIVTTRGCPGKCSFCSAYAISGRKIRYRSPLNVFEEMSILYDRFDVRKFMFHDNCFTSHKENLINLCAIIINGKMDVEWDCVSYERLDNLTDDTLSLMYRAGCRTIHMGIESGSENTRKVMNKLCCLKEITEKVKIIQRNGIKVVAWFMIGFPQETKAEIKKTIDYAFSLNAELLTFTICFPIPGSQVYYYIKEKYKFDKIDWANFDIYRSVFPVSEVSSKKLRGLLKMIRFKMYINRKIKRFKSMVTTK